MGNLISYNFLTINGDELKGEVIFYTKYHYMMIAFHHYFIGIYLSEKSIDVLARKENRCSTKNFTLHKWFLV